LAAAALSSIAARNCEDCDIVGKDPTVEIATRFVLPRDREPPPMIFSTKFGAPEHICVEL